MRKAVRYVGLLLIFIMAFSLLTGCAGGEGPSGSGGAAADRGREPETIQLKVMLKGLTFSFPDGVQTDTVAKAIAEKTGVEVFWIVENNYPDFANYQRTLISSNDLPDIMCKTLPLSEYYQADILRPLDDLLGTYGRNIVKNCKDLINAKRLFNSKDGDGKLYMVTTGYKNSEKASLMGGVNLAPYIRWDLYRAVGSPGLATPDDMLNALKLMQEKFPTNKEGKKAYAMSGWFGDSWGWVIPHRPFQGSFGWEAIMDEAFFKTGDGIEKKYSWLDEGSPFLEGYEFWNKAYKMGLVDPDTAIMKWDQYQEKCKAGLVYFGTDVWSTVTLYNPVAISSGTPEKGFMPVTDWTKDVTYNSLYQVRTLGDNDYFITKACKYPERAMQLLDFLWSEDGCRLLYNGSEGEQYTVVDGKPQRTAEFQKAYTEDMQGTILSTGAEKYPIAGLGKDWEDSRYPGSRLWLGIKPVEQVVSELTEAEKIYCEDTGVKYPYQYWIEKETTVYDASVNACFGVWPEDLTSAVNEAKNYMATNAIKLIIAEDFEAEAAKFRKELSAIGYDRVLEYAYRQYEEIYNKLGKGR